MSVFFWCIKHDKTKRRHSNGQVVDPFTNKHMAEMHFHNQFKEIRFQTKKLRILPTSRISQPLTLQHTLTHTRACARRTTWILWYFSYNHLPWNNGFLVHSTISITFKNIIENKNFLFIRKRSWCFFQFPYLFVTKEEVIVCGDKDTRTTPFLRNLLLTQGTPLNSMERYF